MKEKKGSINAISQKMNLSESTISKALNNCGSVNSQTKEAILKTAMEFAYTPAQKKRVKEKSTGYLVGVVMPINPHYFWDQAMCGMQAAEMQYNHFRVVFSLFSNLNSEQDALYCFDYIEDLQVDLLIIAPPPFLSIEQKLEEISKKIPVVCFNEAVKLPYLFYVGSDHYWDGVRLANACAQSLQTHPGILKISFGSHMMANQRDEGFRRKIMILAPKAYWVGTIDTQHLSPTCFSAQLARILNEKYSGKFQAVYVSQGVLPQVCLAISKLKLTDKVVVFGYENPEQNAAYTNNKMITALLKQDTYMQGVRCIEAVYAYLSEGRIPVDRCVYIPSKLYKSSIDSNELLGTECSK